MIKSSDIAKVLTAAAPIVASIVAIATKTEVEDKKEKEKKEEPVSVTINNTFYTTSEDDAKRAAKIIQEQIDKARSSETRYML